MVSHDDCFWDDLQKRPSRDSAHVGRHLFQIKVRWAVPLPRGILVGLITPNEVTSPQNRNMKHYKSLEFLSNFQYQAPPAQA